MAITKQLIAGRDHLLDWGLGIRLDRVLNPPAQDELPVPAQELAAELKRAVSALTAEAYDPATGRIAYSRLSTSEAYHHYRTHSAPRLRALELASLVTRQERLAFWINLYNALVIHSVIAIGPQRAGKIRGWSIYPFLRRAAYAVGGHRFSCEDIEHGVLRGNRGNPFLPGPHFRPGDPRRQFLLEVVDPRIHCALNCGRRSCPPIGVYDAQSIDAQLDLAARNFVAQEAVLRPREGMLSLSPIFRWYARDFGGPAGVLNFLLCYWPDDQLRSWLRSNQAAPRMVYHVYDWSLNGA